MRWAHTAANQAKRFRSKKVRVLPFTNIIPSSINESPIYSRSWTIGITTDVLIPLMIRGPGITPNTSDSADIYSMTDLGATILSLAGATANYTIDGRPISLSTTCPAGNTTDMITVSNVNGTAEETRHTISEYWAVGAFEGIWASEYRLCGSMLWGFALHRK